VIVEKFLHGVCQSAILAVLDIDVVYSARFFGAGVICSVFSDNVFLKCM